MRGVIVSYVRCLRAGYILGEDEYTYFVREEDISDGSFRVGTQVDFSPVESLGRLPRAKGVKRAQTRKEKTDGNTGKGKKHPQNS